MERTISNRMLALSILVVVVISVVGTTMLMGDFVEEKLFPPSTSVGRVSVSVVEREVGSPTGFVSLSVVNPEEGG